MNSKNKLSVLESFVSVVLMIFSLGLLNAFGKDYGFKSRGYNLICLIVSFSIFIGGFLLWKKISFKGKLTLQSFRSKIVQRGLLIAFFIPFIIFALDIFTLYLHKGVVYVIYQGPIFSTLYILKYIFVLPVFISLFSIGLVLSELRSTYTVHTRRVVFSVIFIGLSFFFQRFFIYEVYDIVGYVVLGLYIIRVFSQTHSIPACWLMYVLYITSITYGSYGIKVLLSC